MSLEPCRSEVQSTKEELVASQHTVDTHRAEQVRTICVLVSGWIKEKKWFV